MTTPHAQAPATWPRSWRGVLRHAATSPTLTSVPEAALIVLVSLALAAGVTVSLGVHRPWTTLPLALVIGWGLWKAVPPVREDSRHALVAAQVVLAGTGLWIAVGLVLASQFLIVVRDPGFLALSGVWLTDHASTDIPARGAVEAAMTQPNIIPDAWQAWNLEGQVIQPQGAKMLPALLSVGGWIAGVGGVLAVNVIVGGVGVLAVYVLARRMMGPLAALGPAGVLALTVSHQGLSRSPYSEPLTLVLIIAAVVWAWRGLEERRAWAMVAAGVASGATALVRIDGAAYAIGVLLGVVAVALARAQGGRRLALAFALPQAAMLAAGYGSLAIWSAAYLERLGDQARSLGAAYAVVLVVVLAAVLVWGARDRAVSATRFARHAPLLARWTAGASVALVAILASRPLWMTDRRGTTSETDEFTNGVVAQFQQLEGYPIDGTRTYAEHTLTWMSYYLTWPVMALAAVGLGVLAYRAVARNASALVFLGAVAAPTAIYVIKPEIVPDQIWAIRRFEPITMPGLAIAAGVGAWWLLARFVSWRGEHVRATARKVAAAALLLPVLSTYISVRPGYDYPVSAAVYAVTREQSGALDHVDALCDLIDGRPVVLAGSSQYFGTIRVMCDVPVVLALVDPQTEALAQMVEVWGQQPLLLTQDPAQVGAGAQPVLEGSITRGEYALQHMPRLTSTMRPTWYAAVVEPDGTLSQLSPGSAQEAGD